MFYMSFYVVHAIASRLPQDCRKWTGSVGQMAVWYHREDVLCSGELAEFGTSSRRNSNPAICFVRSTRVVLYSDILVNSAHPKQKSVLVSF